MPFGHINHPLGTLSVLPLGVRQLSCAMHFQDCRARKRLSKECKKVQNISVISLLCDCLVDEHLPSKHKPTRNVTALLRTSRGVFDEAQTCFAAFYWHHLELSLLFSNLGDVTTASEMTILRLSQNARSNEVGAGVFLASYCLRPKISLTTDVELAAVRKLSMTPFIGDTWAGAHLEYRPDPGPT